MKPSENECVDYAFCSSQCETCLQNIYIDRCTTCPTSLYLTYQPITTGLTTVQCNLAANANAKYFLTISRKSITVDGQSLEGWFYQKNVIEFTKNQPRDIRLIGIPTHKGMIFRTVAYTECTDAFNHTLYFTLYGKETKVVSTIIPF